ncbi:alanyl-tRNA editing protein [Paenibacillus sp. OV219]|uniref:alanyl-tRNA editing protein n=1 Tax=Paenibacillus sp. OV219 TaxID=1884377 RepID=UPI0008BE16CD|nr:alanyl-tRNA editing protein [Paenibacillus sp. OV219]SEO03471.1 alanyl-tRNA synthetase [Paenibacillus sp. OV219]
MTIRLYYNSSYVTEWETKITKTLERDDGWYVLLEESAFYPHGGGQPCDTGTINGVPVLDVISEEDEVLHKVERLPDGTTVLCQIDWQRRFDHMQQHSGQHLLSAVCLKLFGAMTLSFHLGIDSATIDVERPELTLEHLSQLELEVNQAIYDNHRIASYTVSEEEASRLPLVKSPTVTGNVRIVEIENVEYNACGGTHVASTGGIGMIKLLRTEKIRGNTRISFKCANRALKEFNDCLGIIGKLSLKFNTGKEDIVARVEKWEQEEKQILTEMAALKEQNDSFVARELLERQESGLIAHQFENKPLKDLQSLAIKLSSLTNNPVLLVDLTDFKVVLSHSGRFERACGAFFKEHLGEYGGKGGGSGTMAQAGFGTLNEVLAFYEFAKAEFRSSIS